MPSVSDFNAGQYHHQIYNEGGIDVDQANSVLQQIEELSGEKVCCICYEPTADMISPFTCGHHLHRACVTSQLASGRTFACPLCRNTMRTQHNNAHDQTTPTVESIRGEIAGEGSQINSLHTDLVSPYEESDTDHENQAENVNLQNIISALEETVTNRFEEIDRRFLEQVEHSSRDELSSTICDDQVNPSCQDCCRILTTMIGDRNGEKILARV